MSPASGDATLANSWDEYHQIVSIQLMSPASGDPLGDTFLMEGVEGGFHSINVPSEWGPLNFKPLPSKVSRDGFRRSGKKVVKPPTDSGKKPPKPLPSKRPKFPTKKSTLQPFYLTFGKTTQ